jgi:hypothetical protein
MMQTMASQGATVRATRTIRFAERAAMVLATLWRRLTNAIGPSYRPEQRYMRGPGPKWRARNSRVAIGGGPHRRNDNHAAGAAR